MPAREPIPIEVRLEAAAAHLDSARLLRDRVVHEAHRDGLSYRAIARALGMTHQGVRKILARPEVRA